MDQSCAIENTLAEEASSILYILDKTDHVQEANKHLVLSCCNDSSAESGASQPRSRL